jgi:hypothetical protein
MMARDNSSGTNWIAAMPVVLPAVGIVLYGIITVADERFYEALGISSSDVGLNYANTLVRANGMVLLFVILVLYVLLPFAWSQFRISRVPPEIISDEEYRRVSAEREWKRKTLRRRQLILSGVVIIASLVAVLPSLYLIAANRADLVFQGHAVGPVRIVGLTILPISADPAMVQWITPEPKDSPVLPRHLLFLGQAGGLTPLYDPSCKQIIWLPSTLISVQVNH